MKKNSKPVIRRVPRLSAVLGLQCGQRNTASLYNRLVLPRPLLYT